ncbi:MAG: histidine--tRNA ligase [Spirochaetaceae bacterium]|nr:MAG: histidine--tRNA ligase [Spirochaetaceae bacterium]
MSDQTIEPRVLKGFRDILPWHEAERQRIMQLLAETFARFGFVPIDTPILEYTEILLGKGGGETDKQVFRFDDNGGRDVAMRYDLTVPFARFMAAHLHELYLPFKRFHMAKAFRGENTQRGRYREFIQCDFDTVGTDSASADFEIVLMIDRAFAAMGVNGVHVHLSHRGLFNALLRAIGAGSNGEEVLRIVDKLRKIGRDRVSSELDALIGAEARDRVLAFVDAGATGAGRDVNARIVDELERLVPDAGAEIGRLRAVVECAGALGIADRIVVDPSITRGLDYYTGIVFETFLDDLPQIGSVCSGGRYDNLASLYTKERLPGVGASIGLDRLMAGLEELGLASSSTRAADTIVLCTDEALLSRYHAIADALRTHGVAVDVYPEARKIGGQYALAEKKGIPTAILTDADEPESGRVTVRVLSERANHDGLSIDEAAALIARVVQEPSR